MKGVGWELFEISWRIFSAHLGPKWNPITVLEPQKYCRFFEILGSLILGSLKEFSSANEHLAEYLVWCTVVLTMRFHQTRQSGTELLGRHNEMPHRMLRSNCATSLRGFSRWSGALGAPWMSHLKDNKYIHLGFHWFPHWISIEATGAS